MSEVVYLEKSYTELMAELQKLSDDQKAGDILPDAQLDLICYTVLSHLVNIPIACKNLARAVRLFYGIKERDVKQWMDGNKPGTPVAVSIPEVIEETKEPESNPLSMKKTTTRKKVKPPVTTPNNDTTLPQ